MARRSVRSARHLEIVDRALTQHDEYQADLKRGDCPSAVTSYVRYTSFAAEAVAAAASVKQGIREFATRQTVLDERNALARACLLKRPKEGQSPHERPIELRGPAKARPRAEVVKAITVFHRAMMDRRNPTYCHTAFETMLDAEEARGRATGRQRKGSAPLLPEGVLLKYGIEAMDAINLCVRPSPRDADTEHAATEARVAHMEFAGAPRRRRRTPPRRGR
jgi:hypothetical protein